MVGQCEIVEETEEHLVAFQKASCAERLEEPIDGHGSVVDFEDLVDVEVDYYLLQVKHQEMEDTVVHVSHGKSVASIILLDDLALDELSVDAEGFNHLVGVDVVDYNFVLFVRGLQHRDQVSRRRVDYNCNNGQAHGVVITLVSEVHKLLG
jgi:hypothetical protein